jgi:predicted nucleic acid-binding protein
MPSASGYLLDTNILLYLLRRKEQGEQIDQRFGLRSIIANCIISVVTVGEMESLARKFTWGPDKIADLKTLLDAVPWVDINDSAIIDAYGRIDHFSESSGRPMGKNDVWIAATAHVTQITLLTTDNDFDHLQGQFLNRIWIDPNFKNPT